MMRHIFLSLALATAIGASAELAYPLSSLPELMAHTDTEDRPDSLRNMLLQEISDNPASQQMGTLCTRLGELELSMGLYADAAHHFATGRDKGVADAYLGAARLALIDADPAQAETLVNRYFELRKKSGGDTQAGTIMRSRIKNVRNALAHVQQIVIVDSISAPKDDFLTYYRIPASQGRLIAEPPADADAFLGFRSGLINDLSDRVFFTAEGANGLSLTNIYETRRSAGGEWTEREQLALYTPDDDGPYMRSEAYPWMMPDGTTLYYAALDDADGLGGLDIYMTTRDPEDGSWRASRNLGMPFNSAANDYMMAYDEENGVGWWATDRNAQPGCVTIYAFITPEYRVNYPSDTADTASFARIDSWRDTWPDDEDLSEWSQRLQAIDPSAPVRRRDFTFPIGEGRFYYTLDEFPTDASRLAMEKYLEASRSLTEAEQALDQMRADYHNRRTPGLASAIQKAEAETDRMRMRTRRLRSDVYKSLK